MAKVSSFSFYYFLIPIPQNYLITILANPKVAIFYILIFYYSQGINLNCFLDRNSYRLVMRVGKVN